jgi:tyrosyl-tRNA synthetase
MSAFKSDFLRVLQERGFIHQLTDEDGLDAALAKTQTAYIGFDATADSLHVGSLLQIMLLRWFQKTGHRPLVLMGGGTTKVGDPSGKDESRQLLTAEQIDDNIGSIRAVFEQFLTFGDGPTDAILANNADWLDGLEYIAFLREIGCHFTINRMLTFDSVKLRLDREQPLTFLEFNYMILQAYDFVELARRHDCTMQMGGSDQWGNIINGIELGRRLEQRELFGVTSPLITTSSGAKMGKSAQGAVWLNTDKLSSYDYWQFWRNTEDADVGRFLKLFTELPIDEIARVEALDGAEINDGKILLATEATAMLHGRTAADEAAETARKTFVEGGAGEELPTFEVPLAELEEGIAAFELFRRSELVTSGGEARRLIKGGGGRLNDVPVADAMQPITTADIGENDHIKLSAGKKRHALIRGV